MKTYKSILVQMVFLLMLSHISFSQEVEVNLGGNSTSDAFVVKDSSGSVLLRMDGDRNFGINTDQPDGIDIRGREGTYNLVPGSVSIIGGSGYPNVGGSVFIASGYGLNGGNIDIGANGGTENGGNINIYSGSANFDAGDINISTGISNNAGGSITLSTGGANGGGNDIILKTGGTHSNEGGNSIKIKELGIELNVVAESYTSQGIRLSPAGGLVQVIGSGTYTGTWTQASDERYKTNIIPLSDLLKKVNLLQPVGYEWNKEEFPENNFPDGNQIGLIAQEVEKLFPEIVATNQDGYKSIDYSKISVLLIQAMKEQQSEIEQQSDEISEMKSELEELKSMIMQDSNKFSSTANQKEVN